MTAPAAIIAEVLNGVCEEFGVTLEELKGRGRARRISVPRKIAYRRLTRAGLTSKAIGEVFGRDHATVLRGRRGLADPTISDIDKEILVQIALGASNGAIAKKLYYTEGAIDARVHQLLGKTNALNRAHLAAYACLGHLPTEWQLRVCVGAII